MNETVVARPEARWQPPERPEWVQRINDEGRCMDIRSVVPLDAESLLDAAMRATGLSDFGDEDWREPFLIAAKALDEEADLNLMGRIRTRSEMLLLLQARLGIEDAFKRHPEIAEEVIERPVFIVGQGRSGTSFLHNILAAAPENGVTKHWEVLLPAPPPEQASYLTDERNRRGHLLIDQWNRVTPSLASMHEFAGHLPIEDCHILGYSFRSPVQIDTYGQVPSYDAYMVTADMRPAFRYHKRTLQMLQWRNPRKRWVLKDPTHIDRVEALLECYPDACLVWTHRDAVKAMASIISLIGTVQWGRSDHVFKGGSFEYLVDHDLAAARLTRVIDLLESGVLPKAQLFNMQYTELIADPMGAVEALYRYFDLPLSDEARAAMARYLAENPREARPAHKPAAGSREIVAAERRAFARYTEYFGVVSE